MLAKNLQQFIVKQAGVLSPDYDQKIWNTLVNRLQKGTLKSTPDLKETNDDFLRNAGPSFIGGPLTRELDTDATKLPTIGAHDLVSVYLGKKILLSTLLDKLRAQRDTYNSASKYDKYIIDRLWGPQNDTEELFNDIRVVAPPPTKGKDTLTSFRNNQAPMFWEGFFPQLSALTYDISDKSFGTSPAHYQGINDLISIAPDVMSKPNILAHEFAHGYSEDYDFPHEDDIHENVSDATPGFLRLRRRLLRSGDIDNFFDEIPEDKLLEWLNEELGVQEGAAVLLPEAFEDFVELAGDTTVTKSKEYPKHVLLARNEYRELMRKLYEKGSPTLQKFMRQLVIKGLPRHTAKPFWQTIKDVFNPNKLKL